MKKKVIVVVLLWSQSAWACDICSIYMKLGINDSQSTIGLNYRTQHFHGTFWTPEEVNRYKHFNEDELVLYKGKEVFERYTVYELQSEYYFTEKLSLAAFFPIKQTERIVQDESTITMRKISDPSLLAKYRILNSKTDTDSWFYRAVVGAGVKLPVGGTENYQNGAYLNPDLQAGSGSYDLLSSIELVAAYKFIGVSTNFIYKHCLPNLGDYTFGNSFSSQSSIFGIIKKDEIQFMPSVGFYSESEDTDTWDGESIDATQSNRYFISYGGEIVLNRVSISGYYQDNIHNDFSGVQLPAIKRVVFGLKYFINNKKQS